MQSKKDETDMLILQRMTIRQFNVNGTAIDKQGASE